MSRERVVTQQQEDVYRLVSGDFEGLTSSEAAKKLGISERAVQYLLERMEKRCPDLFPIITRQEREVLTALECGHSQAEIAETLDLTTGRISQIVASLVKKKRWDNAPAPRVVSYHGGMDSHVERKF